MQATRPFSPLKSGLWALTLGTAAFLFMPASASAAPKAKDKQQHSFRMQISTGGQLGAQVTNMSDDLRKFFGAPKGVGILVDQVMPDTPAAKAGLKSGDVITKVERTAIDGAMDIFAALAQSKKGDTVSIEIIRGKKKQSLQAKLEGNSALGMHWGSVHGGKNPFAEGHPFGPQGPFGLDPLSEHHDPFGPGKMKIEFGKDFPFHQGPEAMQEKMRELEERLNYLEGKKSSKSKTKKKLKKSERRTGPKS